MSAKGSTKVARGRRASPLVLVVDDEVGTVEVLKAVLVDEGYEVVVAHHGRDALAKARGAVTPSVVLLDFVMPVLDGAETLRAMRADPRLAAVPVVMMSGVPEGMVKRRCGKYAGFLRKPFSLDELLRTVRALVAPAKR